MESLERLKVWSMRASILTLVCAMLPGCPGRGPRGAVSDVPRLDPVAWEGKEKQTEAMRIEKPGGKRLLITGLTSEQFDVAVSQFNFESFELGPSEHLDVYRYDPDTEEFEIVDGTVWDSAGTPIRSIHSPNGPRDPEVDFSFLRDGLMVDGQIVPLVGEAEQHPIVSPVDPLGAILMTEGPCDIYPYGPVCEGQSWHYLFDDSGERMGKPLRIGLTSLQTHALPSTWSLDGQYIVYTHYYDDSRGWFIVRIPDEYRTGGS